MEELRTNNKETENTPIPTHEEILRNRIDIFERQKQEKQHIINYLTDQIEDLDKLLVELLAILNMQDVPTENYQGRKHNKDKPEEEGVEWDPGIKQAYLADRL